MTKSELKEHNRDLAIAEWQERYKKYLEKTYNYFWDITTKDEKLKAVKERVNLWYVWLYAYDTAEDMAYMIEDYFNEKVMWLSNTPTVPWLLSHLRITKESMIKALTEEWNWFWVVLSLAFLKIESILLESWLKKHLSDKILNMVLKNYHWLQDRIELHSTKTEDKHLTINIIQPSPVNWEWKIIDWDLL